MHHEGLAPERLDQLRLLRDSVEAFARDHLSPQRTRALRRRQPEFDPAMHQRFAQQGWLGLLVPEALGGYGLGLAEAAEVAEPLAAALVPEPWVPVAVAAAGLLSHAQASKMRDTLLEKIITGEEIPLVAWQDPTGAMPTEASPFRVIPEGTGWLVEGEAAYCRPGSGASVYLLLAQREGHRCIVICDPGIANLEEVALMQADGTALLRLRARRLVVDSQAVLELADGALETVFDHTLLMNAVELLAVAACMRRLTLDYLKTRVQFGKPIGSFQALQHRAVDLLIQEELGRAVIAEALAALEAQGTPAAARSALASRAKVRAAEAARTIARESMQMHGGVGITDEYDLALYVNRSLALAPWLGTAAMHRARHQRLNPPRFDDQD